MKKQFYFICLACLTACSSYRIQHNTPILLPEQPVWLQLEQLDVSGNVLQTSLLSVQGDNQGATRWVQTDMLGAPQARLVWQNGKWRNDGFMPPNRAAQKLYEQLFDSVGKHNTQTIRMPNGQIWRISPIES